MPNLGDLSGAYKDLISTYVENFIGLLGWENLGSETAASLTTWAVNNLAPSGNPQAVYEGLFNHFSSDVQQKAPWAEFGITADSYSKIAVGLNSTFYSYTGLGIDPGTLRAAFQNNWSTDDLLRDMQSQSWLMESRPWLQSGQRYTDVVSSFAQTYGVGPKDPDTLASWFRFNQSGRTVTPTSLASGQLAVNQPSKPTSQQTSEIR